MKSPLLIGSIYFAFAFLFSLIYYFVWKFNSDAFIVHQEMNLRPLSLWKIIKRQRVITNKPPKTAKQQSIESVYEDHQELLEKEAEIEAELAKVSTEYDKAHNEVKRLLELHNKEIAENMKLIIEKKEEAFRKNTAAAINMEPELIFREAAKTQYQDELAKNLQQEEELLVLKIKWSKELNTTGNLIRTLLEGWEQGRQSRLSYFDFLYFSMGVATSNTFGDIIPNDRVVRFLIVIQLMISLTLVGLFVNSFSGN